MEAGTQHGDPCGPPTCILPLGGRATPAEAGIAFHYFGAVATLAVTPSGATFLPFTQPYVVERDRCRKRKGVLRLALAGREIQRSGEGPFEPLDTTIFGAPILIPPAGASVSPRTQIKAAVIFDDHSPCPRTLFFDIGQTIEIVSDCCVSIALMMPVGMAQVGLPPPAAIINALVIDAFIKVGIWELEAPIGALGGHFTDTVVVPANTTVAIPVPDGAQEVQIFQSTAGAAALSFTMWYGDPTIIGDAQEHGVISFEPVQRETPIKRVGNATHIRTDLNANDARMFTVVWRIES
jgi:hypothetical protein